MEIDPSPARPNELESIELTGIDDYILDQKLAGLIRDLRSSVPDVKAVSETVLMLLAQQLPAQLEYQLYRISKLEHVVYERLLGLIDEAIRSGQYSKLRRLSMPFASLVTWNQLILQRDVAKESSRTRPTQRACHARNSDMYACFTLPLS